MQSSDALIPAGSLVVGASVRLKPVRVAQVIAGLPYLAGDVWSEIAQGPGEEHRRSTRKGILIGRVVDAAGAPIAGAGVFVGSGIPVVGDTSSFSFWANTDAAGHYSIIVDPPGPYNVVAAAASFEDSDPAAVTIMLDTTTQRDFRLVTAMPGSISGTVVDADTQEAIKGATLEAIVYPTSESRSASTDATGNYMLSDVLSGRRQVMASARHYDDSSAQTVRVIAGQTVPGVNFSLTLVPKAS